MHHLPPETTEIPSPVDLALQLDRTLEDTLETIDTPEWDENHISFLLVRLIRYLLAETGKIYTRENEQVTQVRAEVYKASGRLEQTHGDIAVAVHQADMNLTGMGFYEAKAADHRGEYPAFKMRQLRRLVTSTPRLSLLLYEREREPVGNSDFPLLDRYSVHSRASRVRVLGANLASRFRDPRWVGNYSQSFGHHFVSRYLSGRDLDYSRTPNLALRRWLKVTKRSSPLIVGVTLAVNPSRLSHQLEPPPEYERVPQITLPSSSKTSNLLGSG